MLEDGQAKAWCQRGSMILFFFFLFFISFFIFFFLGGGEFLYFFVHLFIKLFTYALVFIYSVP